MAYSDQTYRDITTRLEALRSERASWMAHWKDVSDFILPRSGRYFIQDRNRGEKRHNNIYDNTGTRSLRILGAGLMGGATSPARPWFRLATPDPDLMKYQPVKVWLNEVTQLIRNVFAKSNTYRALHMMYEELGAFGTAASFVMDDFEDGICHYPMTVGEYMISTNYKGSVNTLYREYEKQVSAIVAEFGYKNCSSNVQRLYDNGNLGTWISIVHAVEPRADRDLRKADSQNMPYRSVYFEKGNGDGKFLRDSGMKRFRALCPRWQITGGDIYGHGPGMDALGDIKQLQHEQLSKGEAIDYKVRPPLKLPTSLKTAQTERLPGGIVYADDTNGANSIRTLFDVNLDLSHLLADVQDVRERIRGTFYTDLFMMLSQQNIGRMTATEVAERHEEKLLMLGPVLERLHNEMLSPLIDMTFDRLVGATGDNGESLLPPPPEELQDQDLNVEFVSMLAQAQRAVNTNAIDRYVANLGVVATGKPDVLDKFNADKWADVYGDMLGIDPELIVADDKVAIIRKQRAEQQQAMQQAALAEQAAKTAQAMGNTPTTGQNALTDAISLFSGYTG